MEHTERSAWDIEHYSVGSYLIYIYRIIVYSDITILERAYNNFSSGVRIWFDDIDQKRQLPRLVCRLPVQRIR